MGGGGWSKYKKNIRARNSQKNSQKNSCTPIKPNKSSCYGRKKIQRRNLIKKNTCDSKIPYPPPPVTQPITFLMVRPLGLFGCASAKRETRNRTQLRHVCHLQLDFWTYRGRFHLSLSYCQGLLVVVRKFNMTVASSKLIGSLCTQSNKACLPKCDLTYFFVQLCFDSITYRHQTTIVQHKVTCLYRWLSDCKTNHSWLTYVRLLAFAAKLCTSSGVKLLRWLPD